MPKSDKKYLPYILAVGAAGLALSVWQSGDDAELTAIVKTPQGSVQGVVTGDGFANFKGLPFAAPPVGDMRWRAPAPAPKWAETLQASEFSSMCMQQTSSGADGIFEDIIDGSGLSGWKEFLIKRIAAKMPVSPLSEDCLYLNVRTPALKDGAPVKTLPVMVWIHGGNHQFGSGDFSYYQGDGLPAKDVVLVTINYRLGAFGYLSHPALSADDPNSVSGNYGTLDQIAALKWVQDNISAYGGDKDNVTIFGESAGAWSVTELMASPLAAGLFHKAIGQSGSSVYHMGQMDSAGIGWISGYETAEMLDDALGLSAPTAAQLRALPASDIVDASNFEISEGFHHVADGYVFPQSVGLAFKNGDYNKVPLLIGYNADEATLFYPDDPQPTVWSEGFNPEFSREEMSAYLSADFPTQAQALVDLYNLDMKPHLGGEDMMGDEIFGMNVRYTARAAERDGADVYAYTWNRVPPSEAQTIGAFHSAELPFVFDTHETIMGYSDEDNLLTEQMLRYWANFAHSGNPNIPHKMGGEGLPEWPKYGGQNWLAMEANTGEKTRVVQNWRKAKLDALSEGLELKLDALDALKQEDLQSGGALTPPQNSQDSDASD